MNAPRLIDAPYENYTQLLGISKKVATFLQISGMLKFQLIASF